MEKNEEKRLQLLVVLTYTLLAIDMLDVTPRLLENLLFCMQLCRIARTVFTSVCFTVVYSKACPHSMSMHIKCT